MRRVRGPDALQAKGDLRLPLAAEQNNFVQNLIGILIALSFSSSGCKKRWRFCNTVVASI